MRTFYQQYLFEHRMFFRDKVSVFWNFFFPLFFLLLFGALKLGGSIDFILPGIIVMGLFSTCVITTAISFVLFREKGYYRRMEIVPIKRVMLLFAQILQRYLVVIVQAIFLIFVAFIIFSASLDYFQLEILILISCGIFTFLSLGFLVANLASNVETANVLAMLPFFIMLFLGGAFWPLTVMPHFLQVFATFLPTTYLVNGIRDVVMIDATIFDLGKHILVLLIWGIGSLLLAIKFFRWE